MRVIVLGVVVALAGPTAGRAQIGEVRLQAGVAQGIESGGLPAAPVLSGTFALVKSGFSIGPEVLYVTGDDRVFGLGVAARWRLGTSTLSPYLAASLGGNFWRQEDFGATGLFSGSLGGGIAVGRSEQKFTVEARVHENLQRVAGRDNWAFVTLAGGVRFGW